MNSDFVSVTAPFAKVVHQKLAAKRWRRPKLAILTQLLDVMFFASIKTEEAAAVRCGVTYADPSNPDPEEAGDYRAFRWKFVRLEKEIDFSVSNLVKLSRGLDSWVASIAVFADSDGKLKIWGLVDQVVHFNMVLVHEPSTTYYPPGQFHAVVNGPGEITVFREVTFLGALKHREIVAWHTDAIASIPIHEKLLKKQWMQLASGIHKRAKLRTMTVQDVEINLHRYWTQTLKRILIGIRRNGHGGALLITPRPTPGALAIKYSLRYDRLSTALCEELFCDLRYFELRRTIEKSTKAVSRADFVALEKARVDREDRETERTGAVRLVTSLASVDGLVLCTPNLEVSGFGVKIQHQRAVNKINHFTTNESGKLESAKINPNIFGTRHTSMIQYCNADPMAVGLVVSQDGDVRMVTKRGRMVDVVEDTKLMGYETITDS